MELQSQVISRIQRIQAIKEENETNPKKEAIGTTKEALSESKEDDKPLIRSWAKHYLKALPSNRPLAVNAKAEPIPESLAINKSVQKEIEKKLLAKLPSFKLTDTQNKENITYVELCEIRL